MRQDIQDILDKAGECFAGDIIEQIANLYADDELALAGLDVTYEEYAEINAFFAEMAKKLEAATRRFSEEVAVLHDLDQRWGKWREAAQAAGKTDLSLGAWRNEVWGTDRQSEAFIG